METPADLATSSRVGLRGTEWDKANLAEWLQWAAEAAYALPAVNVITVNDYSEEAA